VTFSFFHWACPNTVGGGWMAGAVTIGLGAVFATMSLLPGTKVRGAFSRLPGVPATITHRVIFFLVGAAGVFEGAKYLFACR
jgi:hypothetical protein